MSNSNTLEFIAVENAWTLGILRKPSVVHISELISFDGDSNVEKKVRHILVLISDIPDWSKPPPEDLFPSWFIKQFCPEITKEEADKWLMEWRALPPNQAAHKKELAWSFKTWMHWLQPNNKSWFIESFEYFPHARCTVTVALTDWFVPKDSLIWLLSAAGARNIKADDD